MSAAPFLEGHLGGNHPTETIIRECHVDGFLLVGHLGRSQLQTLRFGSLTFVVYQPLLKALIGDLEEFVPRFADTVMGISCWIFTLYGEEKTWFSSCEGNKNN